jgi:hypothetical protein
VVTQGEGILVVAQGEGILVMAQGGVILVVSLSNHERRSSYPARLAAIRSKSPPSTASNRPLRQPPFMLRTSGEGAGR